MKRDRARGVFAYCSICKSTLNKEEEGDYESIQYRKKDRAVGASMLTSIPCVQLVRFRSKRNIAGQHQRRYSLSDNRWLRLRRGIWTSKLYVPGLASSPAANDKYALQS